MDPTKSFDHLDPKLKDTYARVMGTSTNGTPTATPPGTQPSAPAADPALTAAPNIFGAQQPADPTQNQFSATTPGSLMTPPSDQNIANPGTGPTLDSTPTDTSSMFSSSATTPAAPAQSTNTPDNASFFSNPSPATTEPMQAPQAAPAGNEFNPPVEPATVEPPPVTPYTPQDTAQNAAPGQMAQPLPSPASVNQAVPHEASALLRVLYIIGAAIFFAVYTIFWIKVFNLPFFF